MEEGPAAAAALAADLTATDTGSRAAESTMAESDFLVWTIVVPLKQVKFRLLLPMVPAAAASPPVRAPPAATRPGPRPPPPTPRWSLYDLCERTPDQPAASQPGRAMHYGSLERTNSLTYSFRRPTQMPIKPVSNIKPQSFLLTAGRRREGENPLCTQQLRILLQCGFSSSNYNIASLSTGSFLPASRFSLSSAHRQLPVHSSFEASSPLALRTLYYILRSWK